MTSAEFRPVRSLHLTTILSLLYDSRMDILITVTSSVLGFFVMALGAITTFFPRKTKKSKLRFFCAIIVVGLASIVSASWQSVRTNSAQEESKQKIDELKQGVGVVKELVAQPNLDKGQLAIAIDKLSNSLNTPFADDGTTLSANRKLKVTEVDTLADGTSGSIELNEPISGRILVWSVGAGAPQGRCMSGSIYTDSGGIADRTLYVCETEKWIPK